MATRNKFNPLQGLTDQLAVVPQPHTAVSEISMPPNPVPLADTAASVPSVSSAQLETTVGANAPTPISNKVTAPSAPARPSKTAVTVRKINVYIDPVEQEKLSELDIFLRTQHGIRPSESHIMRAALVLLKSNSDFVHVIRTLHEQDRRRNRHLM